MHDPSGDLQRLMDALATEWNLKNLQCDLQVLQTAATGFAGRSVESHCRRACRIADHRHLAGTA